MYNITMDRFWNKVNKTDGCWIWTASKTYQGYGYFRLDGRMQKAHRVSYKILKGQIPNGMMILHSCHNPSCVNPEHLRIGTNQENMRDMSNAKRGNAGRTHCKNGHEFNEINTRYGKQRICRICDKLRNQNRRKKVS